MNERLCFQQFFERLYELCNRPEYRLINPIDQANKEATTVTPMSNATISQASKIVLSEGSLADVWAKFCSQLGNKTISRGEVVSQSSLNPNASLNETGHSDSPASVDAAFPHDLHDPRRRHLALAHRSVAVVNPSAT